MNINEVYADVGHNRPPDSLDALQARVDELTATADRWLAERPEITDQDMAEKCTTLISQVMAELKIIEKTRKDEKAPHIKAGKAVNAKYKPMIALLIICKDKLKPLDTFWLQGLERKRIRDLAEAQAEAEAKSRAAGTAMRAAETGTIEAGMQADAAIEESKAAAKEVKRIANSRVRIESPHGQRATSLRTHWHAELTHRKAALNYYWNQPELAQLLIKFANADARAGMRHIPGFKVYSTETAA